MRFARALALVVPLLASGCFQDTPTQAPTTTDPASDVAMPEATPTTWYLHHAPTGTSPSGQPSCATVDAYMDLQDTAGDCGAHGRRFNLSPLGETPCADLCFVARNATTPTYALEAPVEVMLYLTADAVDQADIWVQLLADGTEVGVAEATDVVVFGTGGATFQEVPVTFRLTAAIPAGAELELHVEIKAIESYFVGYEGASASRFTIG